MYADSRAVLVWDKESCKEWHLWHLGSSSLQSSLLSGNRGIFFSLHLKEPTRSAMFPTTIRNSSCMPTYMYTVLGIGICVGVFIEFIDQSWYC